MVGASFPQLTFVHMHRLLISHRSLNNEGGSFVSTASICTCAPVICGIVCIILSRRCKHLLVVVYRFLSRIVGGQNLDFEIPVYVFHPSNQKAAS